MGLERLLVVPDCHIPYEDKRAWRLMIKAASAFQPTIIVAIGDLADFFSVSIHSKAPTRARKLEWEIDCVNRRLDELDALGAKRRILLGGNHEDRLRRYLCDKAPELFGLVDIPDLFKLPARGWQFVPYKYDIQIGKLRLTHDVGNAGRYAAFRALDTYQHSVVTGHSHRMCYVVEGNAAGEFKLSCQFGWLGDARAADYMARVNVLKNWPLGFGVGYADPKTGIAYLTPVPIVRYTCCLNGELHRA